MEMTILILLIILIISLKVVSCEEIQQIDNSYYSYLNLHIQQNGVDVSIYNHSVNYQNINTDQIVNDTINFDQLNGNYIKIENKKKEHIGSSDISIL